MSDQGARAGGAALLAWARRAWPWVLGLAAVAGIVVGRVLVGNAAATVAAVAVLVGLAIALMTLAVRGRATVAPARRACPGALVIPGWAGAATLSGIDDAPGTGRRPTRLRAAVVATERSLTLWRLDTHTEVTAVTWDEVAAVEVRGRALGPFTAETLALRLTDGTELDLRALEPWAGGPVREPGGSAELTYAGHLAARLRAAKERSAAL